MPPTATPSRWHLPWHVVAPRRASTTVIGAQAVDAQGNLSSIATVSVDLRANQLPIASAGGDRIVLVGAGAQRRLSDPDGSPLTYRGASSTSRRAAARSPAPRHDASLRADVTGTTRRPDRQRQHRRQRRGHARAHRAGRHADQHADDATPTDTGHRRTHRHRHADCDATRTDTRHGDRDGDQHAHGARRSPRRSRRPTPHHHIDAHDHRDAELLADAHDQRHEDLAGTTSDNWSTASSWSPAGVPIGADVRVSHAPNQPRLPASRSPACWSGLGSGEWPRSPDRVGRRRSRHHRRQRNAV